MSSSEAPICENSIADAAGAEIPTPSAKTRKASVIRVLMLVVLISVDLSVRRGVEGDGSSDARAPSPGRREGDLHFLSQLPVPSQRLLRLRIQLHRELHHGRFGGCFRRLLQAAPGRRQPALAGDLD